MALQRKPRQPRRRRALPCYIDVAFTSDIAFPIVVSAARALITLWGLTVLLFAGPRTLSGKEKVVALGMGP